MIMFAGGGFQHRHSKVLNMTVTFHGRLIFRYNIRLNPLRRQDVLGSSYCFLDTVDDNPGPVWFGNVGT